LVVATGLVTDKVGDTQQGSRTESTLNLDLNFICKRLDLLGGNLLFRELIQRLLEI
jgi:hypothetical protein